MILFVKKFLIKRGWYEYIRYSFLFSVYTWFFKRRVIQEHKREVKFYKSFLPPCSLIFDIGAYDGHKTAAFLELADRVVSCEPDQHNFRTLQIRFRNYRSRVFPENKALSDHTGSGVYHIHYAGSAFNTLNPKWKQILERDNVTRWNVDVQFSEQRSVQLTTLDQLISQYGIPEFIKIDVEGYEEWVLRGLTIKVPYLSFECLLPDCEAELFNCLQQLHKLDSEVTFNVAYEEVLLLETFISYKDMCEWVSKKALSCCFEVIAKMTTQS